MRRFFGLAFTLISTVLPAASVYAGASCFDACSGPVGQLLCGSVGLGCPPGGGQCIQCRDNNDCQPGGTCSEGQCIGLPCSPDAGTPMDSGQTDSGQTDSDQVDSDQTDSGPEDSGVCGCDVSSACDPGCEACDPDCAGDGGSSDVGPQDAQAQGGDASLSADARVTGGGAGAGSSDRSSGCDCATAGASSFTPIALLALLILRRRTR
jgi:uncharacterized protein (TIGR03382 family)